jgi:hypothetical protein
MKTYALVLSILAASCVASTAQAAHHARHHKVVATKASTTDWPGNTYFDLRQEQRDAFFRDAINPLGAKW